MGEQREITLGMAQMRVEGGQAQENLGRAAEMIRQAASQGCQIAVLPECLDLGWTHPSARRAAEEIPGPTSDALCRAAAEAGIWVVAGLTERAASQIHNAALLIDPAGRVRLKHRKINLLDIERDSYSAGRRLEVAETDFGTVGVNICADNFPETLALGHSLALMGATLLLSPCAWAVPADHDPQIEPYGGLWLGAYRQLAARHRIPVIGVSNVGWISGGPWSGRRCIGCSLAVGADGQILAQADYGVDAEQLVVVHCQVSQGALRDLVL